MNLFKPFNKLFFLFLFLIIAGCQNDQFLENVSSTVSKKNVEQKSLKDLPNLIPVVENLKKIKPKTNHYARTTETFLGVDNVITDDIFVYKDDSGYSTYSFKIHNPENNLKFENLHLIETENGFVAYIMSYDPDPLWYQEKGSDPHRIVNLQEYEGMMTKFSLEREIIYTTDSSNYTTNSNMSTICTISLVPYCYGPENHDHSNGINPNCPMLAFYTVETCYSFFGLGSAIDSGTTGNNGDSGNNGSNQNAGGSGVSNPCNSSGGITGTVIVGTQPISGIGTGCSPNQTVVVGLTTMYVAFLQQLQQNSFAYGWYMNNANIAVRQSIQQYLSSPNADIQFALELIDLVRLEPNLADVPNLVSLSIITKNHGLDNSLNNDYINQIDPYVDLDLSSLSEENHEIYLIKLQVKYQVLKASNPTWSESKLILETLREAIHLGLDILGLVPFLGEPADLVNGVLYSLNGDTLNASLSFASALPIVGYGSTATKFGLKARNYYNAATNIASNEVLVWKITSNLISFGDRAQLRKVLGLGSFASNGQHAHHLIPWEFRNWSIIQKAAKSGDAWHMNDFINGIPIPSTNHLTGHDIYNNKIGQILTTLSVGNPNPQLSYQKLTDFSSYLRNLIENNQDKNLGQIANLISYP